MFKEGTTFILTQSIVGRNEEFNEGLPGTVIEVLDRKSRKSCRVQFIDGRVAVIPPELLKETTKKITEEQNDNNQINFQNRFK